MTEKPLSFAVPITDVAREPRRYRVVADAGQRALLAEAMNIPEVVSLEADLEVRALPKRSYGVRGTLKSEVVQSCVVSLEPVQETVSETIDVTLVPAAERDTSSLVDPEADGGQNFYENGRIDLGVIVAEHLALGLNPYPRRPGIDFKGHIEDMPGPADSPFAGLAALKSRGD